MSIFYSCIILMDKGLNYFLYRTLQKYDRMSLLIVHQNLVYLVLSLNYLNVKSVKSETTGNFECWMKTDQ